jgi:hypothetical protein
MAHSITKATGPLVVVILCLLPLLAFGQQDTTKPISPHSFAHDTSKAVEYPDTKVADTLEQDSINGWFVVETRHRMYPNFHQIDTVAFGQPFEIGEGDVMARIVRFNPSLAVAKSGEILQMSDTLNNPAIRVRVIQDGKVTQESWAFTNMAPHFRRENFFGFKLIEFRVDNKRYIEPPDQQKQ